MKTFFSIIVLALAFTSCKGANNKTAPVQVITAFEQTPFLVIDHREESSVLRSKLLHLKFSDLMNISPEFAIKSDDQFKLANNIFGRNTGDQIQYENMLQSSAEVIVSYSDREEIYFVPSGIQREQVVRDLGVQPEEGKTLDWAPGTPSILSKKSIYYLVSASREELIENDRKLFYSKTDPSLDIQKTYSFSSNQKVVIKIDLEFFVKETAVVLISGKPPISCKNEMREAGLCETCKAKMEKTTGRLVKTPWTLNDFGLFLILNGKETSVADLSPIISADGKFLEVTVDISKSTPDKVMTIQLVAPRVISQMKTVSSFGFEGLCSTINIMSSTLDLTPQVHMTFQMTIFGKKLFQ